MPRKATIIVTADMVLAAIQAAYRAECEAVDGIIAESKAVYDTGTGDARTDAFSDWWRMSKYREELTAAGMPYDLVRFAGRQLTPTERVYWQRRIRELEAAGKVVRYCNNIRPALEVPVDG